ncbi:MAG: ABC transporter ATP-binding protein [Planctomycetes bacterium]|nr:ABC transporter ATP-binding protein [Planctomycetota bacterium]
MTMLSVLCRFIAPYKQRFFRAVAMTMLVTIANMAGPMIVKILIDDVITVRRESLLMPVLFVFVGVPVLAGVLGLINNYMITYMGAKIVMDMRRKVYGHLQGLPLKYYDHSSTGMLLERLMGDVGQIRNLVTQRTVMLVTDIAACFVAMGAMLYLNAQLALIPLLFIPIYVCTHRYFRVRVHQAYDLLRSKIDDISGTVSERIRSTAIVKAFGQERNETKRLLGDAHDAQEYGSRAHVYSVAFMSATSLQVWLVRIGIMLLGYYLVIRGKMTLGAVVALTAYSTHLLGPARRFAALSNVFETVMVSIHRIAELLDEPLEPADRPDALELNQMRGEVEFKDLSFEYESDQPVLTDINLHVPAGKTVALVGHTGCGKTTMISLLYRFYEATSGQILIDGIDIAKIKRASLRRYMSIVPQDPVVFEGTVRENIAYGEPTASIERVMEAARIAELHDVVMALPDGIDSKLGGADAKLSLGQKQRLMIARAVLTNPAILVMDEATSSLDGESERALQDALDSVMADRTSFVIAHRLSTIINADMIVVMDSGKIMEVGSHKELLAKSDGLYRQLYLKQFAKVA